VATANLPDQDSAVFPATVLRVRPDGPNVVSGDVVVTGARSMGAKKSATVVLCRCGMSKDKPFCDGTHTRIGFKDPAILPPDAPQETLSPGSVTIIPTPNGPFECRGPLTLLGADGRTSSCEETWLCRCGHSQSKPFCDGSHKRIGFRT
jgi:CDGSH iron-sulfur domain-containing protein 3